MAQAAKKTEDKAETAIQCPMFGCCSDPNHPACRTCAEVDKSIFDSCQEQSNAKAPKRTRKSSSGKSVRRTSEAKLFIQNSLEARCFTRDQIIDGYMIAFPEKAKSTVMTYLSDSQNPKYNAFPKLVVVDKTTKIMHYEEEVPDLPDYATVLRYQKAKMDAEKAAEEPKEEAKPEPKAEAPKKDDKKKSSKKKPASKKKK
ncbi:MAG: hypothetical protein SVK08_02925 [Halobacteriota archaeon]|nr:hypothetical protein [Halobacteriota archaeon]